MDSPKGTAESRQVGRVVRKVGSAAKRRVRGYGKLGHQKGTGVTRIFLPLHVSFSSLLEIV